MDDTNNTMLLVLDEARTSPSSAQGHGPAPWRRPFIDVFARQLRARCRTAILAFAVVAVVIGVASCVSPASSAARAAEAAPEPPKARPPAAPAALTAPPGDRGISLDRDDANNPSIVSYEVRLSSLADTERAINNLYAYLRTLVTWLGNLEDAFDTHIHPTPAPFGTTEYTRRRVGDMPSPPSGPSP